LRSLAEGFLDAAVPGIRDRHAADVMQASQFRFSQDRWLRAVLIEERVIDPADVGRHASRC